VSRTTCIGMDYLFLGRRVLCGSPRAERNAPVILTLIVLPESIMTSLHENQDAGSLSLSLSLYLSLSLFSLSLSLSLRVNKNPHIMIVSKTIFSRPIMSLEDPLLIHLHETSWDFMVFHPSTLHSCTSQSLLNCLSQSLFMLYSLADLSIQILCLIQRTSIMALLVENPHPEYFKSLPHICSAAKYWNSIDGESLIRKLGEIFVRHKTFNDFGLVLLHNHFEMAENEILVETFNKSKSLSVAFPWNIKGTWDHNYFHTHLFTIETIDSILKSFPGTSAFPNDDNLISSYALKAQKFVVPQTWVYSKDSPPALIAYEFLSCKSELPAPSEQFAIELYEELKEYGLESVLGVRRLLHMRNRNSWETTPDEIKANITRYGTVPRKISWEKLW